MSVEQVHQEGFACRSELEGSRILKDLVRNSLIIPLLLHYAQLVIIVEVAQNCPAYFHFQLSYENALESAKRLKIDSFSCLLLIVLVTFMNKDFLESCYVISLQILIEYIFLELDKLLIVQ